MSLILLLVTLVPFGILVLVSGTVAIVALCRARPEDVPVIFQESAAVFRRLVNRLPRDPASHLVPGADIAPDAAPGSGWHAVEIDTDNSTSGDQR
jgi:hypothetical protein